MQYCPRYNEVDPVLDDLDEKNEAYGGDYEMDMYEWFYTGELAEAADDYYDNLPGKLYEESTYALLYKEHEIHGEDAFNTYDTRMVLLKPFKLWHSWMWSVRHEIRQHYAKKNGLEY